MAKNNLRTRNYATIVYPDSAPDNWLEILSDLHIPCFVSPLHDQDITADGEIKKAHYHVLIMFDSVKTIDQARDICILVNGVGCEVVNSTRAYSRYLCHLDDYDKYKYDPNDVLSFGGADYLNIIGTMSDKFTIIREMLQYINENDINSFYELLDYAKDNNSLWFDGLINNCSYVIKEYIKSRTWKIHKYQEL